MLTPVSPYALLRASKPKHTPTMVTTYDLYSTSQSHHRESDESASSASIIEQYSNPSRVPSVHTYAPTSQKRTHYISDIHARHNKAAKTMRFKQF